MKRFEDFRSTTGALFFKAPMDVRWLDGPAQKRGIITKKVVVKTMIFLEIEDHDQRRKQKLLSEIGDGWHNNSIASEQKQVFSDRPKEIKP